MAERAVEAAFPYLEGEDGQLSLGDSGITVREYYAAAALQGLLANPAVDGTHEDIATDAVEYATALLAAMSKKLIAEGKKLPS